MQEYPIKTLSQNEFPAGLHEIPQPPEKLFFRGVLPTEDTVLLTVVGSRACSAYGKEVCEKLISEIAGYDITIVSGLALGIDTIAHKAALSAGLKTIAVPGSGLHDDVLYPRTNYPLARKILESGGALLSEFDEHFRATPWSFPQRNRIMAGMAQATLIIEAEERSGTLITARLALDYNRDVFVVPGSIFSSKSKGTHKLIRLGAAAITSGADLLTELGFNIEEKEGQQKLFTDALPDEKRVLSLLTEPLARDELIRKLSIPVNRAQILLSGMEIKGFIEEHSGKIKVC